MKIVKLLTKALAARFLRVGSQEGKGDEAIVIAKFFTPDSSWTWWATEYDPVERIFFGLVQGHEVEWGYFSLDEMAEARGPLGLPIERDLWWTEKSIGQVKQSLDTCRAPQ
jgi:hypothetical protein